MICPQCKKPYLFLKSEKSSHMRCLSCSTERVYVPPSYAAYHEHRYEKKKYERNPDTDPQMKKIIMFLSPQEGTHLLDLGCGVGDYTAALTKRGSRVTGIDQEVKAAKEKYPNLFFQEHDCNQPLSLDDASFDALVSVNVIEHLRKPELFLSECQRVLKPGGRIAVVTANLDFFLHDFFYDETHLHEWDLTEFGTKMTSYFSLELLEKSSSMFHYFPWNKILTRFLKPDLLFLGTKA